MRLPQSAGPPGRRQLGGGAIAAALEFAQFSTMTDTPRTAFCSNCGAPATGKFCNVCGTAIPAAATTPAAPGAPGAPEAPAPARRSHARMWTAVSLVAFLAVALVFASHSLSPGPPAPPGGMGGGAGPMAGGGGAGAPPDISRMTPAQRARLLHDLVLRAYAGNHMDTVQRFSPMAIAAYQMLDSMSLTERYDFGRVALAAGRPELAAAQADTILAGRRDDLLGLVLAADAARAATDTAAAQKYLTRLRRAAPGGAAAVKDDEYAPYRDDISAALGRLAFPTRP